MNARLAVALVILALASESRARRAGAGTERVGPVARPAAAGETIVVAAGDVACDPANPSFNGGAGTATACRMLATSDLALATNPGAVLLLGDDQYVDGAYARYVASFDLSWGRLKAITRPAPGNHEYLTAGAAGYFAYFGSAAGNPAQGWYAFDLPGWRVYALNSNCASVGGCDPGSAQESWLRADLAARPGGCTLAYWHHPLQSSGPRGYDPTARGLFDALAEAGADLVLNGHNHHYERFGPMGGDGLPSPAGPRALTVGTGGQNVYGFSAAAPGSLVRIGDTFGILELRLAPGRWTWAFRRVGDGVALDSGEAVCRRSALASRFHALAPCRLLDTRLAADGPALLAGVERDVPIAGRCGVPAEADAVALNATVTQPTAGGVLEIGPASLAPPGASVVAFRPGGTRAGSAIPRLGAAGRLSLRVAMASGSAHVVLDVSGWFGP